MSFFAILANLSTIMGLVHTIQNLIGDVAKTKKVPSIKDFLPLLDQVELILRSGAFAIPNVDEKQIADALELLRTELVKMQGAQDAKELAAVVPVPASAVAAAIAPVLK